MKAVFTGNPYKFWNRTCDCELHLFQDNELADQYAISLINSPLVDEMPCICETPNELGWVGTSWAKLLCDYASCQGLDKIVLHPDDEGFHHGFIEWTIATALPYDAVINWTWPSETPLHIEKIYANIKLVDEEYTDRTPNRWLSMSDKEWIESLCDLLFDLFDVQPSEIYDFYDSNRCIGDLIEVADITR